MKCLVLGKNMSAKEAHSILEAFDPQAESTYVGELGDFTSLLFLETTLSRKQISRLKDITFVAEVSHFSLNTIEDEGLPF